MSDVMMHNETGYELAPWILASIKADALEYFGDSIASIRIQVGSYRHAFNVMTREVRYAFFPDEYELDQGNLLSAEALANRVSLSTPDRLGRAPSDFCDADDDDGDAYDLLDDDDFDVLAHRPDSDFEDVGSDSEGLDDSDTVMIGDEQDDLD